MVASRTSANVLLKGREPAPPDNDEGRKLGRTVAEAMVAQMRTLVGRRTTASAARMREMRREVRTLLSRKGSRAFGLPLVAAEVDGVSRAAQGQ